MMKNAILLACEGVSRWLQRFKRPRRGVFFSLEVGMDWRDIRSSEQSAAFERWFSNLPEAEKAKIKLEMTDYLLELQTKRRRQVDKPSVKRRKRRPTRRDLVNWRTLSSSSPIPPLLMIVVTAAVRSDVQARLPSCS